MGPRCATETVRLSEWSSATTSSIRGFGEDAKARELAAQLTAESKRLAVVEHRDHISVESFSYVGSVEIGPLRIVIEPKMDPPTLIRLLRYGYRLPDLQRYEMQASSLASGQFVELIIGQLLIEARTLILRGIRRSYREDRTASNSPKGRLDFQRLVASGGVRSSRLPVIEYQHSSDNPANRLLLAGLKQVQRMSAEPQHQQEAGRLCSMLEDEVRLVPLDRSAFDDYRRNRSRLFKPYDAAVSLIQIILESLGSDPLGASNDTRLPGFLFDMNHLWERSLERLLVEYVQPPMTVRSQYGIKGMFRWGPGAQGKMDSVPRPDFALFSESKCLALLDAKYRDLWNRPLQRDMLYQLAIYGLSQGPHAPGVILYPSATPSASERSIEVNDPVTGGTRANIILRPVSVRQFSMAVEATGAAGRDMRSKLARACLTGDAVPDALPAMTVA